MIKKFLWGPGFASGIAQGGDSAAQAAVWGFKSRKVIDLPAMDTNGNILESTQDGFCIHTDLLIHASGYLILRTQENHPPYYKRWAFLICHSVVSNKCLEFTFIIANVFSTVNEKMTTKNLP